MDDNRRDLTGKSDHSFEDPASSDTLVSAAIGLATSLGGGVLCGLMIDQFGSIGAISLWALGFLAGLAATKFTQRTSNATAWILVAACVLAYVIAEVCWIHWNIVGAETWASALAKFPLFLKEFKIDAFIAGIFTFFGGQSAYRQTSIRG